MNGSMEYFLLVKIGRKWLNDVEYMVKDDLDNATIPYGLLFPNSSQGYFMFIAHSTG